jgi:hypothetical protein
MCDGNIIYQGAAADSPFYFKSLGIKTLKFENPADMFMKASSLNYPKTELDRQKLIMFSKGYTE